MYFKERVARAWPVPNCVPKPMPSISTPEHEQLQALWPMGGQSEDSVPAVPSPEPRHCLYLCFSLPCAPGA